MIFASGKLDTMFGSDNPLDIWNLQKRLEGAVVLTLVNRRRDRSPR